ncbi:MAG: methionyl-tRNA formyltransferase [bacterium]
MNTNYKNLEKNKTSVVFIGTPDFAVPVLESIINDERLDLKAVITQPDKEVGRKKIITPPPVKMYSQKNNFTVLQPKKIKDANFIEQLKKINPDLIVVAAYGQILPREIIEMPKYGCINIHASLLPKYRGASPIQTAILNGDEKTGITIMKMDEGLDTGDIISQKETEIKNSDTAQDLHEKLSSLGAKLLIKTLPNYLSGKIKPQAQDNSRAALTKIITKKDGEIDFNKSAKEIECKLRAFTPWPGIYTFFGDKKLKILKLKIEEQINPLIPAGKLHEAENNLIVNCGNGALILEEIQLEGKQKISGKEFINGYLK